MKKIPKPGHPFANRCKVCGTRENLLLDSFVLQSETNPHQYCEEICKSCFDKTHGHSKVLDEWWDKYHKK